MPERNHVEAGRRWAREAKKRRGTAVERKRALEAQAPHKPDIQAKPERSPDVQAQPERSPAIVDRDAIERAGILLAALAHPRIDKARDAASTYCPACEIIVTKTESDE